MRLQLLIGDEELEAIDEWRAKNRVWSRSEAVRTLVMVGIEKEKEKESIEDESISESL